jgi:hypothetical protein
MSVWRPSLRLAVVVHGFRPPKAGNRIERARTIIGERADSAIGETADSAKVACKREDAGVVTSGVVIVPFCIAAFCSEN